MIYYFSKNQNNKKNESFENRFCFPPFNPLKTIENVELL
jgi:hypothetical protein